MIELVTPKMNYYKIIRNALRPIKKAYEKFRKSPDDKNVRRYAETQLNRIGLTITDETKPLTKSKLEKTLKEMEKI